MGWGFRAFFFEDDGTLKHVPQRVFHGLYHGNDRMPERAGKSVRSAFVSLKTENKKPVEIFRIDAEILYFDESGAMRHDNDRDDNWVHSLYHDGERVAAAGPVVDITKTLRKKRWEAKYRWTLTPQQITRIVEAIWPGHTGRPGEKIARAKGIKKRKPSMTHEAKRALSICQDHAVEIVSRVGALNEKSLAALIAEIEDGHDADPLHKEIWTGIAAAAERQRQIRRAWDTGKGKWYVIAEQLVRTDPNEHAWDTSTIEKHECDGRAAAEKVARELIAKYADQFSAFRQVDVQMVPEAEYSSQRYGE